MRLRLSRPDITRYADRFDVPGAGPGGLSVTWLGVASLLIDDGSSALLTGGYFSQPGLARVVAGKVSRLEAVIPVHTHFDHALDSALVADRTGALLVGGESAANVGRGYELAEDRIVVAADGAPIRLGAFDVTLVKSRHCPPDRFHGVIEEPLIPLARASAYRCGESWSTLVRHRPTGRRLLIYGSAGFVAGALAGQRAEAACLSVGQLGLRPRSYLVDYWGQTVRTVGARRVILIHWDDFFRPLSKPLRALPYAGDDLDASIRVLDELAERDGVALHLPSVWRREYPWA
ncbi:hypothetical protein MLM_0723 [Mycobacterium lepraemurium]|nr:MBL fold metallo-hydrolase [Mycobacterium lepraemurium]ATA27617.1 hypothetical protein MLM_0723 [Mycobacterium lepraemurium]